MATTPSVLRPLDDLKGTTPPPRRGGNGNGNGGGQPFGTPHDGTHLAVVGMWVALAPILMLFLAFVSAYVVRLGLGSNWSAIELPRLLWGTTGVLLLSSVLLERARRGVNDASSRPWFLATLACGALFVVGQAVAWSQLAARGIHISSGAHSSFFYVLTGAHAVHLGLGLLALAAAAFWPASRHGMSREVVARVTAIYWHFMGVLWVGLFLVLSFWR